jgi:hypothetical protein
MESFVVRVSEWVYCNWTRLADVAKGCSLLLIFSIAVASRTGYPQFDGAFFYTSNSLSTATWLLLTRMQERRIS